MPPLAATPRGGEVPAGTWDGDGGEEKTTVKNDPASTHPFYLIFFAKGCSVLAFCYVLMSKNVFVK